MYNEGLESMKDCPSVDITHDHLDREISALEIEYVMKLLRNGKLQVLMVLLES